MAVTIFDPGSVFTTLSTIPFEKTAPLARALQSVILDPAGFNQFNQVQDLKLTGFTSDVPGIQSRPLQLAIDNLLILSSLTAHFGDRLAETRQNFLNVQETLNSAIRNENPNIRNRAESILESSLLAQILSAAEQFGLLDNVPEERVAVPKYLDFTFRPTERNTFGTTLGSATRNGTLGSYFVSGVALAAGEEITFADLLLTPQGAGDGFIVNIQNELGGTAQAQLLTSGGASISNGDFIAAADFASTRIVAGSGGLGALDFLSISEVNEDGGGGYDERGAYQTIAVTSNAAVEVRSEGNSGEEPIRDFSFYTESGVAYSRIRLQLTGLDTSTYADALSAIQNDAIRIKIGETLIDGSVNKGQIDRLNSSGNELVIVFPYQSAEDGLAQNGLDVEVRRLDGSYDISNIVVSATFP